MANVHGLSDPNNPNRHAQNPGMSPFSIGGPRRADNVPFLNNSRSQGDPRKETMIDMCRLTCCPNLTLTSFTTIITIVDVVMFIISLLWRGIMIPHPDFLTPNYQTLHDFGNRVPYLMRYNFQIWRFLTPVFLHSNFLHLFFNSISQLIIGSQIEGILGTPKMIIVYFLCAIGGNLFGALTSTSEAVGASTAIVGLLGTFIGYIIVNWNRLDPNTKCFMVCMVSFVVIMNVMFGAAGSGGQMKSNQVDTSGHLGGLITGTLVGMAIIRPNGGVPDTYEKTIKLLGFLLTFVYFLVSIIVFYTSNIAGGM